MNHRLQLFNTVLLLLLLLLGIASSVRAEEKFCSDAPYFGVIDGDVHPVPNQITIDRDCTFQNFPESKPLTTTINFQTNDPSIYLIIFNNVIFTGHMACASIDHRIWFSNGSDYGSSNSCQDLFIPVESIDKQSPSATAAVGVPFTYTLTLPSYAEVGGPSINDLHTVTLWDDLAATGADLSYVDLNAYYQSSGTPVVLEPETDPNAPGGVWTPKNLSYKPIELIPNGEQIIVEITVVLDDTATNTVGKTFTNTAKWLFGRLIEGTFYEPLPGEWGVAEPMTIATPELTVTKTSSETALNLGVPATFTVNVRNSGGSDAWNATILDRIPEGMCEQDPTASIDARLVAADGTPIANLIQDTDYSVSWSGSPACELVLTMESDTALIGPSEHLVVTYQAQLDPGTTADGLALTNVAGAVEWFSADPDVTSSARAATRSLSDGTPSIVDHEDSQTVTTALSGYYFQKTATNLNTGADPALSAAPGDRLRYRLRLFNVDQTIDGITISDPLDLGVLDPSTFAMITLPAGAGYSFDPATGLLEITGDPDALNVAVGEEVVIEFEIDVRSTLADGTEIANQAALSAGDIAALTDDPYVNGIAPPGEPADPTVVRVEIPGPLAKANTRPSATIGEQFSYRITVPSNPVATPLYDVRILDNLGVSAADMRFLDATVVSGGTWSLGNSGTDTSLIIEDAATGIDIPAGGQAVVEITVELLNSSVNRSGWAFSNAATYTYNRIDGSGATRTSGGGGTTGDMTVVEPALTAGKEVGFITPAGKQATDPATVGDVLEYRVTLANNGDATAFDAGVIDTLPPEVSLVAGSATARIDGVDVPGFVADPTELPDGSLVWGRRNGDDTLDIPTGSSLVLTYRATVVSVTGADIVNGAYADWTSLDGANAAERTGAGCPDVTAPDDYCAGPVVAGVSTLDNTFLSKTVIDDSWAEAPASLSDPVVRIGDTVTYELTLNLQEYTTRNVVVEDILPPGMALASATLEDAGFSYVLQSEPAAGATGTLRWEFGDIDNPPSGDGTPVDPLTIHYVATVLPDAAPTGVIHVDTLLGDNRAQLSYTGGDPASYPDRLTATERIEMRQPLMSPISKFGLGASGAGSGTLADPYQVDIAADVMDFRLWSCNDGLAPAYGVTLSDLLAPEFDEGDLAVNPPVVKIGTVTLAAGTDYTVNTPSRGGELEIVLLDDTAVTPDQCLTVDYRIGFHTDLTVSKSWSNRGRLAEYRSLPAAEPGRLYTPVEVAEVWVTNLANTEQLLKTLVSPAEATVGEEVVYRITVPAAPMNRALDDVVVTETLHGALEYVGATAVDGDGAPITLTDNSVAPAEVNLGIAHIPAGGQAIITLTARVANNEQVDAGVSFTNTASYTYAGMDPTIDTSSTSGPLTLVEPTVAISKSVANLSRPGLPPVSGDTLRYTLSLTAAGGAEGDTFSDAFDLAIEDSLGLGLAYVVGTAAVDGTGNAIADPAVTGDGVTTAQTLTWSPADASAQIDTPEGSTITVTYDVLVLGDVVPGQELTNSALARWSGLAGDDPFERTGSGTPAVNDYVTTPAATSLITELAVSVTKSVVNVTTGEDPGANASPGDTLRYTIILSNESVSALADATLTDELAAHFAPGTLQLIALPADADSAATDPVGGTNGTGLLDLRNLTLAPQGEAGDTATVIFEATLAPVIDNGTTVLNAARLAGENLAPATSNETSTLIESAPAFEIWKSSEDLGGDPAVLTAGDTLRYSITVSNVGDEDAVGALLQDAIPTFTTYLPGTTLLNGVPVPDPAPGVSALEGGMAIHAPGAVPGALPADAGDGTDTLATVAFDVVIDDDVVDGTIISNQGLLDADGAGSGPAPGEPTDDPDTAVENDPTRDIVGALPLVDARKTVEIVTDGGSVGIVDPGDELRYTITVSNSAATPATGVVFTDAVPVDTTYVADSAFLNGLAVGAPGSGTSPLAAGIDVSSSDLTPPLPGAGSGTLSPGATATIVFDVRVNGGVAPGTVISNQGLVSSNELPDEPTDEDGIDTNGDQPTLIVVGDAQQLTILKEVSVVGGGAALPGSELEYRIRVRNIGTLPATNMTVTDNLAPLAGQASYVPGSATLDGSTADISYAASVVTADYATPYGDLPPGAETVLRFRVRIDPAVAAGTTITNTGEVTWSASPMSETASVSIDVGGTPGSATLNGRVWHDADLDRLHGGTEPTLEGWTVELYRGSRLIATALTNGTGGYRFAGLAPNAGTAETYSLRFIARGAGTNSASLGSADSVFTNGPQRIDDIVAEGGANLENLNLPIAPNGAVYDSVVRVAVPGARLALLDAATATPLPAGCFDDPLQQDQVTALDGYYKFDLNFSDPACPAGGAYLIDVTPPASGYTEMPSRIIPPASDGSTAPFSVPACPGSADDAVPASADSCQVTADPAIPPLSATAGSAGTSYHLHLTLNDGFIPGQSQVFNNPIPVDPVLDGAVAITKTSPRITVSRGELVPYTITVKNVFGVPLSAAGIVDRFPAGFKYVEGSARLDGEPAEPQVNGQELLWSDLSIPFDASLSLQLLLVVGGGVSEGEYVNRAQVFSDLTGGNLSGEATATVRVVPDPTFDCTDVIGKVFDDRNLNGYQDEGEAGLAGARVVTVRGLIATADEHGRFHITCAAVPDEDRGSNFILKLDERSLPTGYRVTSENPRVQRATRGKMLRFNFGATIHRVVSIDLADGAFEPGSTELRLQWRPNLKRLVEVLESSPAVLRLCYLGDVEEEDLVKQRLATLKEQIAERWKETGEDYRLTIETEVFWRRGGPPGK